MRLFPKGTSKGDWNIVIVPTELGNIEGEVSDKTGFAKLNFDNALLRYSADTYDDRGATKVRIKYWWRGTNRDYFDEKKPDWTTFQIGEPERLYFCRFKA